MYVPHPRIRRLSKIPLVGTAALAALIATSVACFTATPQVAQAADAPAITDMTEQDYQALGLGTSEDIPADTVGPYSTDTPTTFATRSEVYMAANGSHGNRYTLRDKLENVERGDIGGSSKLTDGYGSVWGAAKFWQNVNNFDTNSDLYKHSDYGGGTWSYLSNNESSTVSPTTTTVSRAFTPRVLSSAATPARAKRAALPSSVPTATVPPRRLTASHTPERLSWSSTRLATGVRALSTHTCR